MAGVLANQTIIGNIGQVYEMRRVGSDNRAVVDFTVAVTPRKQVNGEWTDGITNWISVTAWAKLAENIKESFRSGDRVVIIGRTDMKPGYKNKDGVDVPARPYVVAEYAGLEVGNHPASSARVPGQRRDSGEQQNAAPVRRSEPAPQSIDDDDLDLDFDLDGGDDTPF